jgi:hypothetical protein
MLIKSFPDGYEDTLKYKVMNSFESVRSWSMGMLTQQKPEHFRFHVLFAELHHTLIKAKIDAESV